jgi:Caspase domain
MANQACLAIGIDRYQHIQPLGYGAADANAIADFFVEQAGWGSSQCLLLSDRSPSHDNISTQPTQENITEWIDRWCWEKLKPNDLLWIFFSGHGICYHNEDYLVPIDGDLDRIPETCIPVRELYQKLGDIGVNAIVCLDINRTQGASFSNQVGKKISSIALESKIPTFFSCQSHEFSHEAASLGHGLFTVALLEALNYNFDLNLETLESYLKERLQNLSNHHWKPVQTPIAVIPGNISASRPIFTATTQGNLQDRDRSPDRSQRIPQPPLPRKEPDFYADPTPSGILISPEAGQGGILVKMDRQSSTAPKPRTWPRWLSISGLVAGLAAAGTGTWFAIQSIAGSGINPKPALPPAQTQSNANPNGDGTTNGGAIVPATSTQITTTTPAGDLPTLARARAEIIGRDATSRYKAILAAQKIPPTSDDYTNAQSAIEEWSQEIYKIAQSYAEKGETKKAIGTAQMVPQSTKIYTDVRAKISEWEKQNSN